MNIFIAKVTLSNEVTGSESTIFHKFASQEEINTYLRNSRYILDFEIVKTYTDLGFKEFSDLWNNSLKSQLDIAKSLWSNSIRTIKGKIEVLKMKSYYRFYNYF